MVNVRAAVWRAVQIWYCALGAPHFKHAGTALVKHHPALIQL